MFNIPQTLNDKEKHYHIPNLSLLHSPENNLNCPQFFVATHILKKILNYRIIERILLKRKELLFRQNTFSSPIIPKIFEHTHSHYIKRRRNKINFSILPYNNMYNNMDLHYTPIYLYYIRRERMLL